MTGQSFRPFLLIAGLAVIALAGGCPGGCNVDLPTKTPPAADLDANSCTNAPLTGTSGQTETFQCNGINNGAGDATGVVETVKMTGTAITSGSCDRGTFSYLNDTAMCTVGPLCSKCTAKISATGIANTGGPVDYSFSLSSPDPDATPNNNSLSDTVQVNEAPAITSGNSTTFVVGTPGTFTVTTTGFPKPNLSVDVLQGSLPGGVTFIDKKDGTGTLAGTPAPGTAGRYDLIFNAHNGVGAGAGENFTLTVVNPVPTPCDPANLVGNTYMGRLEGAIGAAPATGAFTLQINSPTGGTFTWTTATMLSIVQNASKAVDLAFTSGTSGCDFTANVGFYGLFAGVFTPDGDHAFALQTTDTTVGAAGASRFQFSGALQAPVAQLTLASVDGPRRYQIAGTVQYGSPPNVTGPGSTAEIGKVTMASGQGVGAVDGNTFGFTWVQNLTANLLTPNIGQSFLAFLYNDTASPSFVKTDFGGGVYWMQSPDKVFVVEESTQRLTAGTLTPAGTGFPFVPGAVRYIVFSRNTTSTGSNPAPTAFVSQLDWDFINNTATGIATQNDPTAGVTQDVQVTATITPDLNDPGRFNMNLMGLPTGAAQIAFHADNQSPPNFFWVQLGQMNPTGSPAPTVLSGEAVPQAVGPFTNAGVAGSYIVSSPVDLNLAPSTTLFLATINLNIDNTITGSATLNAPTPASPGFVVTTPPLTGTWNLVDPVKGEIQMTINGLGATPISLSGFVVGPGVIETITTSTVPGFGLIWNWPPIGAF
jgi:hypothetical protein